MSEPIRLSQDDVVSMDTEDSPISSTFKVSQVTAYMAAVMKIYDRDHKRVNKDYSGWTDDGVECEILSSSVPGWRQGRVRLTLEFIPDEPEPDEPEQEATLLPPSPLDDLRAKLNEVT